MKQSICLLPWLHLSTTTQGDIRACCQISKNEVFKNVDGSNFRFESDSLQEVWNSEDIKNMRLQMLEGALPSRCRDCSKVEEFGGISKRQLELKYWSQILGEDKIQKLLDETQLNGGHLRSSPVSLDLRLGNKCNLMCRMCNPKSSHLLKQEFQEIAPQLDFIAAQKKMLREDVVNWFEHDLFVESVQNVTTDLRELVFSAGEPMLIPQYKRIVKYILEHGNPRQVRLRFNTNASIFDEALIEDLKNFGEVDFSLSVDAYGDLNSYIRHGSSWDLIERNVKKYLRLEKPFNIQLSPTISLYNIFSIPSYVEWLKELRLLAPKLNVNFFPLFDPEYLSIDILPVSLKKEAIDSVREAIANVPIELSYLKSDLVSLIARLSNQIAEQNKQQSALLWNQFQSYTQVLDKRRAQNLSDLVQAYRRQVEINL